MSVVDAWGQLVSLSDYESPPFQCIENVFRIGRAVGKICIATIRIRDRSDRNN
ncbi:hypothetical protein DPMN_122920 [Dreissena polymorpha]|uniref:Uncharacterized protein n=1 Tax=Dreissena polymorpha TaxID=45954 RepID=A0A9D4GTC2_DREPO|nr:hypothetical protein DPMN_122920 [Dreissena polymorpha]